MQKQALLCLIKKERNYFMSNFRKLWKSLFLTIDGRWNLQIIFHVIYSSLPNCKSISHSRSYDHNELGTGWNNNWGNIKSSGKVHECLSICKENWSRCNWERSIKNSLAVRTDCNEVMDPTLMGRKDCMKKCSYTQGNLSTSFSKVGVCAFADICTNKRVTFVRCRNNSENVW